MLSCYFTGALFTWQALARRVVHYFTIFTKCPGQTWPAEVFFPDDVRKVIDKNSVQSRGKKMRGKRKRTKENENVTLYLSYAAVKSP